MSKSIDTAATVHKELFGVFQLYTVNKAPVAILQRITCQRMRVIMSHHDASSSDQHFHGICWMLASKPVGKHNGAEPTTLYIDLSLNKGCSCFGSKHSVSFCLNLRKVAHCRTIYVNLLFISSLSFKICLQLSLTLLTQMFFCSLRTCRLHSSLCLLSVQLLHSFHLSPNWDSTLLILVKIRQMRRICSTCCTFQNEKSGTNTM